MTARLRIWILVLAMACGCAAARQALAGLLEPAAPAVTASLRCAPCAAPADPSRTAAAPRAALRPADLRADGLAPVPAQARDPPAA